MDTEGLLKLLNDNKVDYVVIGATVEKNSPGTLFVISSE